MVTMVRLVGTSPLFQFAPTVQSLLAGCGKILCSNGSLPLRYESLTVQG
jgi:hypothetical protein